MNRRPLRVASRGASPLGAPLSKRPEFLGADFGGPAAFRRYAAFTPAAVLWAAIFAVAVFGAAAAEDPASDSAALGVASSLATSSSSSLPPFPTLVFDHVDVNQGFSPDLVFCIHQDRRGLLWLGTMVGLVRFDGHEYVAFRNDPNDSTSLSNDDIVAIDEDAAGDLWLGTYGGGVNRYDRATGRFIRYWGEGAGMGGAGSPMAGTATAGLTTSRLVHGIVWDLEVAPDGNVYVATAAGLDWIDSKTGLIRHLLAAGDSTKSPLATYPRSIELDPLGTLWIGTEGAGLFAYDPAAGTTKTFSESEFPARVINDLMVDHQGSLWVGTRGAGLLKKSRGRAGFEAIGREGGYSENLSARAVLRVHEDDQGIVWAGTARGLDRLDPRALTVQHFPHQPGDPSTLSGTSIVALCSDRSGVLWVSCYLDGTDRLLPEGKRFARYGDDLVGPLGDAHRRVDCFLEDSRGGLWLGTMGGLGTRQSLEAPLVWRSRMIDDGESQTPDRSLLPRASIRALVEDSQGDIWVGSTAGLHRYSPKTKQFLPWRMVGKTPMQTRDVNELLLDHEGALWVGTSMGVYQLNLQTGDAVLHQFDPQNPASLGDNMILTLAEDRQHRLWAGTYQGLSRLDADRSAWTRIARDPSNAKSLINNYVFSILESRSGTLWFGTGGGLDRYEESTQTFKHFRDEDGLPSSTIAAVLEDDNGNLWVSTQRGLARLDPSTGKVIHFDGADGLQSNLFTAGAAARFSGGLLAFGGPHGYNVFRPEDIRASDFVPPIVMTRLEISGRSVRSAVDVSALQEIRLAPSERSFRAEFAALDFRVPGRQRYQFRLEGVDPGWIDADDRRTASYSGLAPGKYTLRVRGSSADGVWNEAGLALPVVVVPPFWKTRTFLLAVVLATVALALAAHQVRVRSRVKHALEIERARAEEREAVRRRAAADFHDELGHRLARIGLFSDLAIRRGDRSSPEVQDSLTRIGDEARRLAGDARDFLWALGAERGTLGDLVARLSRFGDQLFEKTEVEFNTEGFSEALEEIHLEGEDRRNLLSIFKEGMTNALRHAKCRHVRLRVTVNRESFGLTLEDDGCGFPRTVAASGHGLRNMQWRAERLLGTIQIASEPGAGTTIALTRPLGGGATRRDP